jgi:hypothetical protein
MSARGYVGNSMPLFRRKAWEFLECNDNDTARSSFASLVRYEVEE